MAGELEFYNNLVASVGSQDREILEVAYPTGRIALRLAQDRVRVTGLDLSPDLLEIARPKGAGNSNKLGFQLTRIISFFYERPQFYF